MASRGSGTAWLSMADAAAAIISCAEVGPSCITVVYFFASCCSPTTCTCLSHLLFPSTSCARALLTTVLCVVLLFFCAAVAGISTSFDSVVGTFSCGAPRRALRGESSGSNGSAPLYLFTDTAGDQLQS